ncbi:saccharopine dehydrogenase [Lactobacillus nasalidis]|uniref:Saccharopine dehydrogenase n=1 Tax=Lactobacillus nasalidis TaxID=2797258 RepID=A0ABQ3W4X3_9LACO|nr:NAD(P)H-binding protein [Lactobacillus nasalidis]GHV97461.1 saccharopine dehydrogenase [Lactobacillus nasalidis]GHV99512.1 saccharopine dehydrogenase [Lactobacillus nasalidis]GHW00329.1 saccharopine dehydrogenase [Lactobacillus nasalidis]
MKLLILAANGQIARLVEERILTEDKFADVELVLFLRRASRLQSLKDRYPDRVTLIDGDLNDSQAVIDAAKGCDMIYSAVVDHDDAGDNRPTKNIIAAAKQNGISRVIETSLLGLYDEVPGEFGKWNRDFCFGGDPEGTSPVKADQLLEESGLDYTTLRLPWLNDRPEVKYSITHRHDKFVGVSGSRRSIADVVLQIVADPSFGSRDSLDIADPATDGLTRPVY